MSLKNKFNVAYIKLATKTEGPFLRCCIWFQGCTIHCPGCGNPDLQSLKPNHILDLDQLVSIVKDAQKKYNIEGVTLTGGEPSLQKNLQEFNDAIRKLDLGIIMFSGKEKYQLEPILVDSVDLLIDGPYRQEHPDGNRLLLGSKNKSIHCVSKRYKDVIDYFNTTTALEEVTAEEYIFINGD